MQKKEYIKKAAIFALAILPVALVGGFFTGVYAFSELTQNAQSQILTQVKSKEVFYIVTMLQSALYATVLGAAGYVLSRKLGLMRRLAFEKKPIVIVLTLTFICGVVLSFDNFIFGKYIPQVAEMYQQKPSLAYWIASVLYGGVIEEVMMRLFVMSLLAFVLWKIFFRKQDTVPTNVLIFSNVIAALLFAAGHLPATAQIFGEITSLILCRCFLLNSFGGLCFGYLYRKHGIQYAMMSHAGAHIVWKIIWVLFF